MKTDDLIEELKSRIDIVDLIAEHVDLKRAGQNYKGLCPFHSEKTPSFTVSQAKQIFHCFGCNKGGDIFAFVMGYENMDFPEAVSYLADKAGVSSERFREGSKTGKGMKEGIFAIHRETLAFFRKGLAESRQTTAYLEERGVAKESIDKFSLGYSRRERDALFIHLKKLGFPQDQIKASGLVYFGEKGTHDFFRDRLMFPISDFQGRTIAFGGRTLSSSKDIPKYINSPDNPIFKKGDTCFGLEKAKNHIVKKTYAIIVEGYLDAIMCHQYGFENAIAPLGTALTQGHLKKLRRFAGNLLLVFDGDAAGIAATRRTITLVFSEAMTAKVLLLPKGEDPDTFLRKHGSEHFKKQMAKAYSAVDFLLRTAGTDKLNAVRQVLGATAVCPDPLQRSEYLRDLSDRAKINEITLREELKSISLKASKTGRHPEDHSTAPGPLKSSLKIKDEEILLSIILTMPEKAYGILQGFDLTLLEHQGIRGVLEKAGKLIENSTSDTDNFISRLSDVCEGEERALITKYSMGLEIDQDRLDANIEDCLNNIVMKNIEKQIKEAERQANETGDATVLQSLVSAKAGLNRRRMIKSSI